MWRFSPFPTEEEKAKTVFTKNCRHLFLWLAGCCHTWIKVTLASENRDKTFTLGSRISSQFKSVTSNHLVRFRSTSPRKNLPPSISRKRAEANFLCSFERAFVDGHCQTKQITWHDFALQGYGIPDLITFAWSTQQNQSPALSLEALRQKLQCQQFTAFELKLRDWRKGLVQAYRYRYFCDCSIVVLPSDVAVKASQRLELFISLDVGLWSFAPDTDVITKYFTPHPGSARNLEARNKAIESILNKIQLCKALK
jgi:hypothetical protein